MLLAIRSSPASIDHTSCSLICKPISKFSKACRGFAARGFSGVTYHARVQPLKTCAEISTANGANGTDHTNLAMFEIFGVNAQRGLVVGKLSLLFIDGDLGAQEIAFVVASSPGNGGRGRVVKADIGAVLHFELTTRGEIE